jgi:hypothetical protein
MVAALERDDFDAWIARAFSSRFSSASAACTRGCLLVNATAELAAPTTRVRPAAAA